MCRCLGATPASIVAALSKDGHMYLLDSANLGGVGGQLVNSRGRQRHAAIHTAPAAYTDTQRVHVALSIDAAPACPPGTAGGPRGDVGGDPAGRAAAAPGDLVRADRRRRARLPGAPISTTTDGKKDAIVWFMNGNVLYGVDGDTGAPIFDRAGPSMRRACASGPSPIAVKGRIIVAGDGHLCSWSVHPSVPDAAAADTD